MAPMRKSFSIHVDGSPKKKGLTGKDLDASSKDRYGEVQHTEDLVRKDWNHKTKLM